MSYKVVFHIDWDDEQVLKMGLGNIANLLKEPDSEGSEIHLVANGQAVRLFKKDFAEENFKMIEHLYSQGVRFCLCSNSLLKFNYNEEDMLEYCVVVSLSLIHI